MATAIDLRQKAEEFKKNEDFENALPFFQQLYVIDKNEWNGYFLAQCLRKTNNFTEARQIHNEINSNYPNFNPIKNEELWLDYSEKIKDWKNDNILEDAEELLAKTNKYDKYTGTIYSKTVLYVVRHLIYKDENSLALKWLDKLDFNVLSNSPFTFKGQKYPSDQKAYYIRYADVLIKLDCHVQYIES